MRVSPHTAQAFQRPVSRPTRLSDGLEQPLQYAPGAVVPGGERQASPGPLTLPSQQRAHRSTGEPSSPCAFPLSGGSPCSPATKDQSDVGSLSGQATGAVIRPITGRPSLLPTSQARTPIGSPHGGLSPERRGRDTGFPRSVPEVRGDRCLLSTGGRTDHEAAPSPPTSVPHCLLGQACQPLWLVRLTVFIADSHSFTVPAA